jgi:amidase
MSSTVYRDHVPLHDASSVARLRGAGAIILGKTVTTEFAMGDPPPTVNPWHEAHTPGGSSSGSAVAVATRMCPLATGSQTAGSVIRPAAYNGVVGLKPTFGLVSRHGVFPVSWTLDTLGWMARSVEDAALALDALAGHDPRDPGSASVPYEPVSGALDVTGWQPRLGIVAGDFERTASAEMQAHFFTVIENLRLGGNTVELFDLPVSYLGVREAQLVIDYTETAASHRKVHAVRADDYAPNVRARIEAGELIPAVAYVQAQRLRRQFRSDLEQSMQAVDALIMPAATGGAPAGLDSTGDPGFYSPWTLAGLPAITLPTGMSRAGLPLGVQMVGRPFDEATLLRAARWVEERVDFDPGLPPLATRDRSAP